MIDPLDALPTWWRVTYPLWPSRVLHKKDVLVWLDGLDAQGAAYELEARENDEEPWRRVKRPVP